MYTHARQFPHLAGMTDEQVVNIASRAVRKHPRYRLLRRIQIAVWLAIVFTVAASCYAAGIELGISLVIAAVVGLAFGMVWNLIWINTALYRITRDELQAG